MIVLKTKEEIEKIRQGGKILASVLAKVGEAIKPGIETGDLEKIANDLIKQAGGRPAFKGYRSGLKGEPFPTTLCVSINNEVVHAPALPSRVLNNGDIVGVDVGMEYLGCFTDTAATFPVGKITAEAKKLLRVTKESLDLAIKAVKPGNNLNHIGRAVEEYVKKNGLSIVTDLVGHGVGKAVHEDPQVPNYVVTKNENIILRPGLVIAIEPMVNIGDSDIKHVDDPFTIVTADGSLSAHFEHTVAVTEDGVEVLTK